MLQVSNYEIYTSNPETGEGGWDIKFVNVIGKDKAERLEALKAVPNFDEVILFNHKTDADEIQTELYNAGIKHFFDEEKC